MSRCEHSQSEVRRMIAANGQPMVVAQCLQCGNCAGKFLKKADWPANPPPWDEDLRTKWSREISATYEAERAGRELLRLSDRAAWLQEHDAYLRSPEWRALREKVIDRESGLCQGCRAALGTQVHHLTYARWRRELLIDLALLCDDCHHAAHDKRESA